METKGILCGSDTTIKWHHRGEMCVYWNLQCLPVYSVVRVSGAQRDKM